MGPARWMWSPPLPYLGISHHPSFNKGVFFVLGSGLSCRADYRMEWNLIISHVKFIRFLSFLCHFPVAASMSPPLAAYSIHVLSGKGPNILEGVYCPRSSDQAPLFPPMTVKK
jgi:hypothetical protein